MNRLLLIALILAGCNEPEITREKACEIVAQEACAKADECGLLDARWGKPADVGCLNLVASECMSSDGYTNDPRDLLGECEFTCEELEPGQARWRGALTWRQNACVGTP